MSLKNDMICKLLEMNGIREPISRALTKVIENLEETNYPTPKYINNIKIESNGYFLYDGCHKMYIPKNYQEIKDFETYRYAVLPIELLPLVYEISCDLKFISSADLKTMYINQFAELALFTHKKHSIERL